MGCAPGMFNHLPLNMLLIRRSPQLELAYWIGPTPGVFSTRMDEQYSLHTYRDMRTTGPSEPGMRDRWIVFHFYFDENRDLVFELEGQPEHTYTGFVTVLFF